MVTKFLSKLFGIGGEEKQFPLPEPGKSDPVGLVRFLVYNLALKRDQVKVNTQNDDRGNIAILIHCDKSDMGRVIGKRGKTISAIRQLAGDAAARSNLRISKIEVMEP